MAVLDTDYASEGRTCGSDDETSEEEDDTDDGPGVGMAERREQAGLGEAAKMVVALVWRNPNVSTGQQMNIFDHTHPIISVHRICEVAHLQTPQSEGSEQPIRGDRGVS